MDVARIIAFVIAYPIAIMVIVRWIPVVRERRWRWFLEHQVAVAVIVIGHATAGNTNGVIVNGAWFAVAALWYALRPRMGAGAGSRAG